MPGNLEPYLVHLPAWLMVLFRLTGVFIFAPLLGSTAVFRQVKIFLALGLSFCVYPMLLHSGGGAATYIEQIITADMALIAIAAAVGLELLVGLVIGYAASLPLLGMQIGGQVIDQQVGMGLAGVFNPELGDQSGPIGEFFFITAMAIFALLGGHRVLLATVVGSFDHVPMGGFTQFGSLVDLAVGLLSASFEMALRVAAPVLCLVFLETLAMGFIARTVPQINILSVGFALRIVMGVMLLVASVSIAVSVYTEELRWALRRIMGFMAM